MKLSGRYIRRSLSLVPPYLSKKLAQHSRRLRLRHQAALARFYLHIYGKTFLTDFYDASREVGVRPFLMWGTLLGCVREGRFLKHDVDIDLGMLSGDYAKKDALIAAMQKRGYALVLDAAYKLKFGWPHRPLLIDVDVFYPWRDKMISTDIQEDGSLIGEMFPQKAFARLRKTDFCDDIEVLIPDPPETILETIYPDWRTPDRAYDSGRDLLNRLTIPSGDSMPKFPTPPAQVPVGGTDL